MKPWMRKVSPFTPISSPNENRGVSYAREFRYVLKCLSK